MILFETTTGIIDVEKKMTGARRENVENNCPRNIRK